MPNNVYTQQLSSIVSNDLQVNDVRSEEYAEVNYFLKESDPVRTINFGSPRLVHTLWDNRVIEKVNLVINRVVKYYLPACEDAFEHSYEYRKHCLPRIIIPAGTYEFYLPAQPAYPMKVGDVLTVTLLFEQIAEDYIFLNASDTDQDGVFE